MIIEAIRRIFYILPDLPKTAQIGVTNECNFNCPMCQRKDLKVAIKSMIILTGWGEPLFHSDIIEMVRYCKAKKLDVRFTTNGALLTDDRIDILIDSGLDAITFSIDQIKKTNDTFGHIILSQLENIKKLKQKITERGSKMKIYTQSVYQKNGEENILDVVDFAVENKLDRVRLTRLDIRFKHFDRPTFRDEKKLIKTIETRLKKTNVGLDFLPHIALDGLAKIAFKLLNPLMHRFGKYCLRTYNDVYINVNGEVTPCCAIPRASMGNIIDGELKDIWKSEEFEYFRNNERKFCGKCDILLPKPYNK